MPPVPRPRALLLAVGALLLCGCSTSGTLVPASGPGSGSVSGVSGPSGFPSTGPSSFPSTGPSGGSASSGGSSPSGGSSSAGPLNLSAALLTPTSVPGYTGTPSSAPGSTLPCTPKAPPLTTTYPPTQKGVIDFSNPAGTLTFHETILVYSDESKAAQFAAAAAAGFSCTTGTFGTTKGMITAASGTPTTSATDFAKRWDIQFADGTLGTVILVRQNGDLLGLTFQATRAVADDLHPNDVLTTALIRLRAAR